jgi:uncharacterized membrane protein YczE|tara:strand:+ start:7757 stop:8416 length:660 start_codon:yes stop_codon:yes gene_type:complete
MNFLKIKNVPTVKWSSDRPLNFKPRIKTLFYLVLGLVIFGFGESLLIHSMIGLSPWLVLAEGIAINLNWSIGFATFVCSVGVLLIWLPLKQKPGVGTILNIIIIAGTIDLSMYLFNFSTNSYFTNLILGFLGVILVGLGSGIYLIANLGPGPRDGLMTGLQRVTQYPIAWVRVCIEVSVVGVGWILGGTVGVGTLLFAFGIGPAVAFGLHLVTKINKNS